MENFEWSEWNGMGAGELRVRGRGGGGEEVKEREASKYFQSKMR